MDFIMNNSSAGKSIIKQLENKNKSYSASFKKNEIDLKEEETKLISQKAILEKKDFDQKVISFNNKVLIYKKKRKNILNGFVKQKNNAQKDLIKKLKPILADYSQKNSISFILPKQSIIIGKSELDLTNTIIEIFDKKIKNIKLK